MIQSSHLAWKLETYDDAKSPFAQHGSSVRNASLCAECHSRRPGGRDERFRSSRVCNQGRDWQHVRVAVESLGQDKTQNTDVLAFPQQMTTDHSKTAQDMMTAVAAEKVTPPTELDEAHQTQLDALEGADGGAFDAAYIDAQNSHLRSDSL